MRDIEEDKVLLGRNTSAKIELPANFTSIMCVVKPFEEDCWDRRVTKVTRYCGRALSTACPRCLDSNQVWRPIYSSHGILNEKA